MPASGLGDPVADAPDGLDPHSSAGQLGPQPGQVDVDGVGAEGVGLVVPDVLRDRAAVYHVGRPAHQDLQDAELGAGQRGSLAADQHLAGGRVELDLTDHHPGRLADLGAALQRPQPGQQLAEVERLDEVVVGARAQPGGPVRGRGPGGQHQHRRAGACPAQPGQQVQAGQPGHPPVKHHDLVGVEAQVVRRGLAVGHQIYDVALLPQAAGQDFTEILVILRDQYSHNHRMYSRPGGRSGAAHRETRRQAGRGTSRSATDRPASGAGIQTADLPSRSAAAVAAPTLAGVVASGAGGRPAVIRPVTNPGRTRTTRTPLPCSESASPRAKASRPALAAPYTKLALRGRTAATEDSTTIVPNLCLRIWVAMASRAVTCPVKLVSIISAARWTSRSTSACGMSTPAAEMTRSTGPSADRASMRAWWPSASSASYLTVRTW